MLGDVANGKSMASHFGSHPHGMDQHNCPVYAPSTNEMERTMKVAITGGTGFIGAHLIRALLDDGHTVRAVVRNLKRAR